MPNRQLDDQPTHTVSATTRLGITQALLDHWNRSLDQLPSTVANILRQTGEELHYIPASGLDNDGNPVHHLQLQAYKDTLLEVAAAEASSLDLGPMLQQVLQQPNPGEVALDALTALLGIVESGGDRTPTALSIFQIVHTRACL